jgi:hypothetical protein
MVTTGIFSAADVIFDVNARCNMLIFLHNFTVVSNIKSDLILGINRELCVCGEFSGLIVVESEIG